MTASTHMSQLGQTPECALLSMGLCWFDGSVTLLRLYMLAFAFVSALAVSLVGVVPVSGVLIGAYNIWGAPIIRGIYISFGHGDSSHHGSFHLWPWPHVTGPTRTKQYRAFNDSYHKLFVAFSSAGDHGPKRPVTP